MFQIHPLPAGDFGHLFALSDAELAARGIVVEHTRDGDRKPCRISLRDARPGERTLLLNFEHHDASSPYRSAYAIYVVDGAAQAQLAPGELPEVFEGRPLAARAFSRQGMLLKAGLAVGQDIRSVIEAQLADPAVAYIHIHNAMHGCYSARVARA